MSDEPSNAGVLASVVLLAGGALFLAAPFLVTQASNRSFEDTFACEPVNLPVLPSEPEKLAALVVEVDASARGPECALRRYRMTEPELAAALAHVEEHPDRRARYRTALDRLRVGAPPQR